MVFQDIFPKTHVLLVLSGICHINPCISSTKKFRIIVERIFRKEFIKVLIFARKRGAIFGNLGCVRLSYRVPFKFKESIFSQIYFLGGKINSLHLRSYSRNWVSISCDSRGVGRLLLRSASSTKAIADSPVKTGEELIVIATSDFVLFHKVTTI